MAEIKTRPTAASVDTFLDTIEPEQKRQDARDLRTMLEQVSGQPAHMLGAAIVGCGLYTYAYSNGKTAEWSRIAFSPRKANLVLYLSAGEGLPADLLARLGKHKTSKGCVYVNKLADLDREVLRELMAAAYQDTLKRWPVE